MRYIGSKRTVLPFIKTTIEETYGNISNAIVADLFAGTACVGEMFKREGARVLSNDYLSFSYALQIEKIKLNGIPESKRSYLDLISLLNAAPGKEGFFFREYSIEGSSHGEYTRNYFSKDNAMKIDGVRTQIELLRVNGEISEDMLNRFETIDEKQWQEKIHNILQLLYPKYICCAREIKFYGGKKDKQPDFLLVDANGFVDILEIKKADIRMLTQYRNNYVATREISGAIQQIEKYIFCLNSSDKAKEDVSKKLTEFLPAGVEVKIVNPQGVLLAGRSNEFTDEQKKDFELIKRQYKHVADIMTYDDLAQRLRNIIASLEKRI